MGKEGGVFIGLKKEMLKRAEAMKKVRRIKEKL